MSVLFDLTDIERVLTEAPQYEYRGTCELCSHGDQLLSEVGKVYICDRCRNTITARIKESNHPFVQVRATMNPAMRGTGQPGHKVRLTAAQPTGSPANLSDELKRWYSKTLLAAMGLTP